MNMSAEYDTERIDCYYVAHVSKSERRTQDLGCQSNPPKNQKLPTEGSRLTSMGRSLRPLERLMEEVVTWCTPFRSSSVKKWGAIAHIICTGRMQSVSKCLTLI